MKALFAAAVLLFTSFTATAPAVADDLTCCPMHRPL